MEHIFPDEQTLIARGKQSTLLKERREQIQRVQDICRKVQGNATLILNEAQKKPPETLAQVEESLRALENAKKAIDRLITLSNGIAELEDEAWGQK